MLKKIRQLPLNPPLYLTLGFALIILLGSLLLNTGWAAQDGQPIGLVDALFTASSATCVTGLTVVNTQVHWTLFGQVVILCLIQIGGLGVMTLATLFPLITQQKIGIASRQIIKEQLNLDSLSGMIKMLQYVLRFSLLVELAGAGLLALRFVPDFGWSRGIWYAVFHSISAYCNAGFDILGDSMLPYYNDYLINWTIIFLVVVGGLGFFVTQELISRKKLKKLSVHSKLVLTISAFLLVFGALVFFILEHKNPASLGQRPLSGQIMTSIFHSTVARTAGFYSLDLATISDSSAFFIILLMFIGASPGSTGGGLKTTTFGVLVLAVISTIRGDDEPVVFHKSIPQRSIIKALALVSLSMALVIGIAFVLTITEEANFMTLLFETVSAYATVGSSQGITPDLSSLGKVILSFMMYTGRLGPLTLAFSIGKRHLSSKLRYPKANISIG